MSYAIAIDGPAGAGKSTIAKILAKELELIYVDTGALYRTVGYHVTEQGIDLADTEAVAASLTGAKVELTYQNGEQRVLLNGEDVSDAIRRHEVSQLASLVSAIPEVRSFLLDLQRDLARNNNVIMDGRDIGTVVLPHADVKIFLTASAQVRAERRWRELMERGQCAQLDSVLKDIIRRDEQDMSRPVAPLRQAEDAVLVDTTHLDLKESLEALKSAAKEGLSL